MMRYVDLSHTIDDGLVTYRGLPAPIICDYLSREASARKYDDRSTFQIGKITMVGNSGTYMDCPFHRFADGRDFSELFISDLADVQGVLIEQVYQNGLAIDKELFESIELTDKAVLIRTDWSMKWNTEEYFEAHPYLTKDAAEFLRSKQPKIVGIDSYNIDDTRINARPVHAKLLGAGIPIVEHLCQLHLLPPDNFYFSAVPPKIKSMGSLPVRAYAKF